MADLPLLQFEALHEGVLLKRYKRFLADVRLDDGTEVTAHCANTGPMTGVLLPGQRVRLRHAPSPTRKLAWTWEQAEVPGADGKECWVGMFVSLGAFRIAKRGQYALSQYLVQQFLQHDGLNSSC